MRALICRQWGEVDQLELSEAAPPAPSATEILINVHATAVNYADAIMVAGKYQTKPTLPFAPGLETAGVVAAQIMFIVTLSYSYSNIFLVSKDILTTCCSFEENW